MQSFIYLKRISNCKIMIAQSFVSTGISALDTQLSENINDFFQPNLAFVFSSVEMDIEKVRKVFEKHDIEVFGVSTCGEIFFNGQNEGIYQNSVTYSLVQMNPKVFAGNLFSGVNINSHQLGVQIGTWGNQQFAKPSFLVSISGLTANGQEIVEGIQEVCGEEATIFGGLAGDDARFEETFVFNQRSLSNYGAVVVALDSDAITMTGLATSGWIGIGSDKIITKASGNLVYTIDDEPALKVYKDHLNIRDEDLPEIGVEYPLLIKKEGREILRAVIGIDREQQSLIFAGTVPEGAVVTFSTSPGFEVVDHTRSDIIDFFNDDKKTMLLLLFSCMARHKALGPIIIDEIREIYENTGTPITGFFTYGEIGNNRNMSCEFYNETCTLAVISEK